MVKGEAELVKDPDLEANPLGSRTVSVYRRYLGKEAESSELVSRLLTIERYLIKVTPIRSVAIREQW